MAPRAICQQLAHPWPGPAGLHVCLLAVQTPRSMAELSIDDAYRRYFALIRAKCQRMLAASGEAEELAQETFVRFWREAGRLDERAALGWMYKTATRLAIDRLRARK